MSNKPIENFRVGNLDFAVWENYGEDLTPFHNFSIKRTYMDGNGQWKDGGEIRFHPQQVADIKLGTDKMYEFWRLGLKQRKKEHSEQSAVTKGNENSEGTSQPESGAQHESQPEPPDAATQVGAQEGFAVRVASSRKSRSR